MKHKVIHFIYDLGKGGAENLLMQTLPALTDFDNYVITLSDSNCFSDNFFSVNRICLNKPKIWQIPTAIIKLRKLLKVIKPVLIHSHLTIPNIIARFATPKNIPLITSVHNSAKYNVEFRKRYLRMLEKKSLHFRSGHLLFVADSVRNDYNSFFGLLPAQNSVLHNFVNIEKIIKKKYREAPNEIFRIISVGSLSYQKNFEFLIKGFLNANIPNTELHIYGEGPKRPQLESLTVNCGTRIKLMGVHDNINEILSDYDLYVSSSLYEGLSLSVLEAMAAGVPQLLTDIPSFREQCDDTAIYYQLNNEADFVSKLKMITNNPDMQNLISHKSSLRAEQLYDFKDYTQKLKHLYQQTIQKSN